MKFIVRTSFGLGSHRKKIITNIYRIQAYDSIMCDYFCIGFINFMFNGKSLTITLIFFHQMTLIKTMI